MFNFILKNSNGQDKAPTLLDLKPGELSINTVTGQLYTRTKNSDGIENITNIDSATMMIETFQPELTVPYSAIEGETVEVFVNNYNKGFDYNAYISGGVIDTSENPFLWTLPSVKESGKLFNIRVSATEYGKNESKFTETKWISVTNSSPKDDASIVLNSLSIDTSVVPYEGTTSGVITIINQNDVVETAIFEQETEDEDWINYEVSVKINPINLAEYLVTEPSTKDKLYFDLYDFELPDNSIYVERADADINNNYLYRIEVGEITHQAEQMNIKNIKNTAHGTIFIFTEEGLLFSVGNMSSTLTDVKIFDVGKDHAVAIKNDGTLWGIGGINSTYNAFVNTNRHENWTQLNEGTLYSNVISGYMFNIFIEENGDSYFSGYNGYKVLNDYDIDNYYYIRTLKYDEMKSLVSNNNGVISIIKNTRELAFDGKSEPDYITEIDAYSYSYNLNPYMAGINDIKKVAMGHVFSLFLKNNGSLFYVGNNTYNLFPKSTSVIYLGVDNVLDIATSAYTIIILDNNYNIKMKGKNEYNIMGEFTSTETTEFITVPTPTKPRGIWTGPIYGHTLFYWDDTGAVYAIGKSFSDQYTQSGTWEKISFFKKELTSITKFNPPLFKQIDDRVFEIPMKHPVICNTNNYSVSCMIDSNGEIYKRGWAKSIDWVNTNLTTNAIGVYCNYHNVYYLTSNNEFYLNSTKISENVAFVSRYQETLGAGEIILFTTLDGKLYGKGRNDYAQLGAGHTTNTGTFNVLISEQNIIKTITTLYASFYINDIGEVYETSTEADYLFGETGTTSWRNANIRIKDMVSIGEGIIYLDYDDNLYVLGKMYYGMNNSEFYYTPFQLGVGHKFKNIDGDYQTFSAIEIDTNYLWCVGVYANCPGYINGTPNELVNTNIIVYGEIISNTSSMININADGTYEITGTNNYSTLNNVDDGVAYENFIIPDLSLEERIKLKVPNRTIKTASITPEEVPLNIFSAALKTEISMSPTDLEDMYEEVELETEPKLNTTFIEYNYKVKDKRGRYLKAKLSQLPKGSSITEIIIELEKDNRI